RQRPALVPHFLAADDLPAYADPAFHEEPWPGVFWADAERREIELIAGTGAATLLTGFGAEETLGGEPYHIADLVRRGRLRAAGPSARLAVALAGLRWNVGDHSRWASAAPYGVVRSSPFLDARVVRLGLGIQARIPPVPGRRKPVLTEALRDVLPPAVRDRRQVESFNEYCIGALARSVPRLERLVRRAPVEELGLLDKGLL